MDATTRTVRVARVLGALAALLVVVGCAGPSDDVDAELLIAWSEAHDDWVTDLGHVPTTLVTSEVEREELLATLPDAVGKDDVELLRGTDLDEVFLVVGGYPRCMEVSSVEVDGGTGEVAFVVEVPEEDEGTMCGWSPYTIDVWAVPIEAAGGHRPVLAS